MKSMTLSQFEEHLDNFPRFTSQYWSNGQESLHLVLDKRGHRRFLVNVVDSQNRKLNTIAAIHKFNVFQVEPNSEAYLVFDNYGLFIKLMRLVYSFAGTKIHDREDYTTSKWEQDNAIQASIDERAKIIQRLRDSETDDCGCDDDDDDYDDDDDFDDEDEDY